MKASQFLNKYLYASSDIKRVYVHHGIKPDGVELYLSEVVDPTSKENAHADLLGMTLSSFRILNGSLIIYVK